MWNNFIYEDEPYIIKIKHSAAYSVILSNFNSMWNEDLSSDDIVNRCKSLNPNITTDNETYINTVLSITHGILSNKVTLHKNDRNLNLEYKTKIPEDIWFKYTFNFILQNNVSLCTEITVPAIQTIQYLEKRQKELCELLRKKDDEIQQHVFENGNIKRKKVMTDKFDQTLFDQSTSKTLCCNLFSKSDEFSKVLISKYGCTEPELLIVKKEEKKITKHKLPVAKQILKSKRPKIENIKMKDETS